jgi:metal-responsive CopG/Arc/MetJ family transcriptional regulator
MPKVKIDKELYQKAKDFAQEIGYSSVDEYVAHLLEREVNSAQDDNENEKVSEQLKGLGYIS